MPPTRTGRSIDRWAAQLNNEVVAIGPADNLPPMCLRENATHTTSPASLELIGLFWPEVAKERPIVGKVVAGVPTRRTPRTSLTIERSERDSAQHHPYNAWSVPVSLRALR